MIERRLKKLTGTAVAELARVQGRGFTPAGRFLVRFADGKRAFAKVAVNEDTAEWLRSELRVYSQVEGPFLPRFLGFEEGEMPLLLIEDLSDAVWPPPWPTGSVAAVRSALEQIAATDPPADVPSIEIYYDELTSGWRLVEEDPAPFLSLGVCSPEWLEAALPSLEGAVEAAPLAGGSLLHFDVRSDNVCITGERAVLVDWNWACVGNPVLDLAAWLPSLQLESGAAPEETLPGGAEGFAALLAGFWAARAGLPPPPAAAPGLRELQRAQLEVALAWAARALGLPPLG